MDARDLRPLNYRGRLVQPLVSKDWLFKQSQLFKTGRTSEATQLHSKDMLVIEDCGNPEVLPSTDDSTVSGAMKYCQIGEDAMRVLIDGVLDSVAVAGSTGRGAAFVIDLHTAVGDSFQAFARKRSGLNYPLYYYGATDCDVTMQWLQKTKLAWLTTEFLDGEVKFPGAERPSAEPHADLLEAAPSMPTLNILNHNGFYPVFPSSIANTWEKHEEFGPVLKKIMDQVEEEWGPPPASESDVATSGGSAGGSGAAQQSAAGGGTGKRGTPATPGPASGKRPRVESGSKPRKVAVDPEKLISKDQIPEDLNFGEKWMGLFKHSVEGWFANSSAYVFSKLC